MLFIFSLRFSLPESSLLNSIVGSVSLKVADSGFKKQWCASCPRLQKTRNLCSFLLCFEGSLRVLRSVLSPCLLLAELFCGALQPHSAVRLHSWIMSAVTDLQVRSAVSYSLNSETVLSILDSVPMLASSRGALWVSGMTESSPVLYSWVNSDSNIKHSAIS